MQKVVVGVAGDIRSRGPAVAPRPEFYLPIAQAPDVAWNWFRTLYVMVRTTGDPAALVKPLSAAVTRVDRDLPLFDVRTMDQRLAGIAGDGAVQYAAAVAARRDRARAGGDRHLRRHRATSSASGRRRSACAWRSAPRPASVVRLVLGQALRPVALGAAIGVAAALAASRVLSSQLFGVSRTDPLTIGAVVATLIGVALVASAVPARRAAAVDPTRALQSE